MFPEHVPCVAWTFWTRFTHRFPVQRVSHIHDTCPYHVQFIKISARSDRCKTGCTVFVQISFNAIFGLFVLFDHFHYFGYYWAICTISWLFVLLGLLLIICTIVAFSILCYKSVLSGLLVSNSMQRSTWQPRVQWHYQTDYYNNVHILKFLKLKTVSHFLLSYSFGSTWNTR